MMNIVTLAVGKELPVQKVITRSERTEVTLISSTNELVILHLSDERVISSSTLYLPNLLGTRWGSGSETVITNSSFIDLNVMTLALNIRK